MGAQRQGGIRRGGAADGAGVERQRGGGDADAVGVRIRRLHRVAERQGLRAGAAGVGGLAGGAADLQGQLGRAGHRHIQLEAHLHVDPVVGGVGVVQPRVAHDRHVGHRRRRGAAVHLVARLVAEGMGAERQRGVGAATAADGAAVEGERAGGDADAVRVVVRGLHFVAERQRTGAAAARVGGRAEGDADPQRQLRAAGHRHRDLEAHLHGDGFAAGVGGVRSRVAADRHAGDGWHGGAAIHLVPQGRGDGVAAQPQRGVGAGCAADAAARQRQGAGGYADAIGIQVRRLGRVAEGQRRGAAAARVARLACVAVDGQRQLRGALHHHRQREAHLHGDRLAGRVGVAAGRAAGHRDGVDQGRRGAAIDLVGGGVGDGQAAERQQRVRRREAADRAAVQFQRRGADADAVGVHVQRRGGVAERERAGAAAAGKGRVAGPAADRQRQPRRAGGRHRRGEADGHVDRFAGAVGVAARRRAPERHRVHARRGCGAPVRLVVAVVGDRMAAQGQARVRADEAADRPRVERQRQQADAVRIAVRGLDDVAELQRVAAGALVQGGQQAGAGIDGQRRLRKARDGHVQAERDRESDRFAGAVGVAARRAAGDRHAGHGRLGGARAHHPVVARVVDGVGAEA